MALQYLSHKKINKEKWDNCIASADNSLIYAYSFYLDAMAVQWDAIIINDYAAVFPLPWKRKYGIKYYYNPPFTAQLGLFKKGTCIITDEMMKMIHESAKYGDIFFNYKNNLAVYKNICTNYVLNLNHPYQKIEEKFKKDLKNNLKKAEKENLTYSKAQQIDLAINLYEENYSKRMPHVKKVDYQRFAQLCKILLAKKMIFTRSIVDETNQTLSIGIFLFDKNRIYNILNTTTEKGKGKESNPYLINKIIKEFSETNTIFDFEGSDIEGIKFFYEKFSPMNEPYFFYHYNHLPKIFKIIKP